MTPADFPQLSAPPDVTPETDPDGYLFPLPEWAGRLLPLWRKQCLGAQGGYADGREPDGQIGGMLRARVDKGVEDIRAKLEAGYGSLIVRLHNEEWTAHGTEIRFVLYYSLERF